MTKKENENDKFFNLIQEKKQKQKKDAPSLTQLNASAPRQITKTVTFNEYEEKLIEKACSENVMSFAGFIRQSAIQRASKNIKK